MERSGVLFICHPWGGGTEVYENQCIEELKGTRTIFRLRMNENQLSVIEVNRQKVIRFAIKTTELNWSSFHKMLKQCNITYIYINHLVTFPLFKLIHYIIRCNIPYAYFIADYYCVCPSFNLLNYEEKYCFAETNIAKCQACIQTNLITEPQINMKATSIRIAKWRHKFFQLLQHADTVIAPSHSTKEIIQRYYPTLPIHVSAPKTPEHIMYTYQPHFALNRLNIAFIGHIGKNKGLTILYELKEAIKQQGLPLTIKVIGTTDKHPTPYSDEAGHFHVVGQYEPKQLSYLLSQHEISIVVISSICPETYSYTTTEALLSGYPVITFNLGAPVERVQNLNGGWVVGQLDSQALLQLLLQLHANREELMNKVNNLRT